MEDTDLDVVSQLLDSDGFLSDSECDNQNNGELHESIINNSNNNIPDSKSVSSTDIEKELKLIQERMIQLQEQLQKKKSVGSIKNPQCDNDNSKDSEFNEKQLVEMNSLVNKKNKSKLIDMDIGLFSSQCTTVQSNENEMLQNSCKFTKNKEMSALYSRQIDSSDDEMDIEKSQLSEAGRKIKRILANPSKALSEMKIQSKISWNSKPNGNSNLGTARGSQKEDNIQQDMYSGLRIINPVISSSTIKVRMEGRKFVRMSSIRLHMRGNDIEGDWVTSGVIIKKIPPAISKNGKAYSIWKMSDLKNCDNVINLFLFGEVHKQYWKTSVGTVIAFLNASIMPDRKTLKSDDISLSVDHPGKVMIIGASKDFGYCRSRRKDGQSCQAVVNLSQGEYCQYHVKQEYSKLSRKRMELQTSYSGTEPRCLRNKILNKQPVIYGGQMYSANIQKPSVSKRKKNGQLTLDSLKMQKKAELAEKEEREKYVATKQLHLNDRENDALVTISSQSEFFGKKLSAPTAGSRNFLKHLIKEEDYSSAKQGIVKSITPKELLKLHKQQLARLQNTREGNIASKVFPQVTKEKLSFSHSPQLGRGLNPGEFIALDVGVQKIKSDHSAEVAKLKAIKAIIEKGPLNQQNPNAVKKEMSPEAIERIKKRIKQENSEEQKLDDSSNTDIKRSKLGELDLNSEKIKAILNRKSSHAHEVEMEDLEKEEAYFIHLEKKEQMENKMLGVTEIVCDVVSCQKCLYTAYQPSELCKNENHPVKRHKAIKRFFQCSDCKHRTWAFTKLPKHCCRNCGSSSFERTSMMKPKEVKLSNETLLIRGEEQKFL